MMFRCFLSLILLFLSTEGIASTSYDVYFLAVGSSHYARPSSAKYIGFEDIKGANKSARLVSYYFNRAGSRLGITLISRKKRFIS